MEIILNNNREIFQKETMTIRELLDEKKFTFRMLVVKINGTLVRKPEYDTATIKNGDNVTVLHLVSGG